MTRAYAAGLEDAHNGAAANISRAGGFSACYWQGWEHGGGKVHKADPIDASTWTEGKIMPIPDELWAWLQAQPDSPMREALRDAIVTLGSIGRTSLDLYDPRSYAAECLLRIAHRTAGGTLKQAAPIHFDPRIVP
jgi:hypothetical protein